MTHANGTSNQPRYGLQVALAAAAAGTLVAIYFSWHGMSNLYGDGIAHLNIARKIVDARDATFWQRYAQLGSPWLPLPHVAMLPFVWNDWMWRSGWAGTIPSLAGYTLAVWAIHGIAFDLYEPERETLDPEHAALFVAALVGLNPGVLYMASTPMTELPFIGLMLLAVLLTVRWAHAPGQPFRLLAGSAIALTAATLTRYEGWALLPATAAVVLIASNRTGWKRLIDASAWSAIAAAGPLYWFWHNWFIYGNALEFLNGPYSARAIFKAGGSSLGWASFVLGNPFAALAWGLLTVAVITGLAVLLGGIGGLFALVVRRRMNLARDLPALLLLVPFAFLVYSITRGEVQIYPVAAIALLNIRYGVPHVAVAALLLPALVPRSHRARKVFLALCAVAVLQYAVLISEGPSQLAVYQETLRNNVNSRQWRDRAKVTEWLNARGPSEGLVLMHAGDLGAIVLRSWLTFERLAHEGSPEWTECFNGPEIPSQVTLVIMREGHDVWNRWHDDPAFTSAFVLAFRTGDDPALEVWERKN